MDTNESEDEIQDSSSSFEPSNPGSEEEADSGEEVEESIRGRKRVRNETSWKKNVRKRCRNEGKEYLSSRGRNVPAKSFQNINCECKKMCNNHVNENERKKLHDSFWSLGDFSKQNTFIHALIKSETIKQKRPFSWLKIRWFRFERGSPFHFKYKETLNEIIDFNEVSLSKSGKGKKPVSLPENQDVLYPQRRLVTKQKKRDMLDLLPYIPPIRHAYFKNIPTEVRTRQSQIARHETSSDEDKLFYN